MERMTDRGVTVERFMRRNSTDRNTNSITVCTAAHDRKKVIAWSIEMPYCAGVLAHTAGFRFDPMGNAISSMPPQTAGGTPRDSSTGNITVPSMMMAGRPPIAVKIMMVMALMIRLSRNGSSPPNSAANLMMRSAILASLMKRANMPPKSV